MIRIILKTLLVAGACLGAGPLGAHETWLEPERYQVRPGEAIGIDIRNGQHFAGMALPWLDRGIERFVVIEGPLERPITGRLGDMPAARVTPRAEGLMVVGLQSGLDRLTYADWAKFAAFVAEKELTGTLEAHRARALPETGFAEVYRRLAKTLIGVGAAEGADRALGFVTEFVALANPYAAGFDGEMAAQLLEDGAPRRGVRVTAFARAPDGTVTEAHLRTDAEGVVRLRVSPGHVYLLDAVIMRPAPAEADAAWLSLWAALSFAVPPAR
jgi:uncharacterized GH25 family protein